MNTENQTTENNEAVVQSSSGSVEDAIKKVLNGAFSVEYLQLLNESHMHAVPENSETHFNLTLVSEDFSGMSKVARHQKIYQVLAVFLQGGVHALALHLYTAEEWEQHERIIPKSPNCMGGSKKQ